MINDEQLDHNQRSAQIYHSQLQRGPPRALLESPSRLGLQKSLTFNFCEDDMDISRLKKKNLQVWIPLFDGIEVLCRHLNQGVFDEIHAKSLSVKFDPRTQKSTETVDDSKFSHGLARAVVVDWRGITEEGEPWPCTPENVDYLMDECTEFRLLVRGAPLSLEKMLALEREAAVKNSNSTSEQN